MAVRIKWFVPANADHPFPPFGLHPTRRVSASTRPSDQEVLVAEGHPRRPKPLDQPRNGGGGDQGRQSDQSGRQEVEHGAGGA
ncbi:hypothetical protein GCM10009541_43700 [Micromonospora gifhornensis]|uniref:Uncharacterized protein n=1 Tax=Micromonospora gifhornensis TaxID=84594 RepID=A0ABQ4IEA0_9ACTN|nr:hypothetical protein Vgi01_29010 [Micromonospora gifhornensis]